ncbi:unnamed protein product [Leptidea sinapis]|uniref:Uncharacterized protein n=1 Tax=Leptidea sinapis TaxID=189913 RepID=A0A5E4R442_9NEOP|nr:unnamed protein product [Leptidea sinapis]
MVAEEHIRVPVQRAGWPEPRAATWKCHGGDRGALEGTGLQLEPWTPDGKRGDDNTQIMLNNMYC